MSEEHIEDLGTRHKHLGRLRWIAGASKFALLLVLLPLLVVGCLEGEPTPTPSPTPSPAATVGPTPTPRPSPIPLERIGVSHITMVFGEEPTRLGAWGSPEVAGDFRTGPGCPVIPVHTICQDMATDVLTYIDSTTSKVVPLSGVQSWEQIADDRWRFYLTPGVRFHNGEEWNAVAATQGIDIEGDEYIGQASHGYTGNVTGKVVDNLTVDVSCEVACPIFPRTAFLIGFQAPAWWNNASNAERAERTIGFGPYVQAKHSRGRYLEMKKYDDYVPNPRAPSDAQPPTIDEITIIWSSEALVRAAMVEVGEADWAMDIAPQHKTLAPVLKTSGAADTFVLVHDTIWHPELSKRDVRLALAHATDCDLIVEQLYEGQFKCQGTYAPPGTVGVTPRTLAQYEYNPDLARELLAGANYNPANPITINVLEGRYPNNADVAVAQAAMWREVGVSAKAAVLETARWLNVARTGCGRAWREHKEGTDFDGEGDPGDTYCLDVPPGPPCFCSPQSYQDILSLKTLDFAGGLGRMDCKDDGSKFCDPVNIQPLLDPARAARTSDLRTREDLMRELVDIAYDEAIIYTYFDAVVFYGSRPYLNWEPRFDGRMRPNSWSLN